MLCLKQVLWLLFHGSVHGLVCPVHSVHCTVQNTVYSLLYSLHSVHSVHSVYSILCMLWCEFTTSCQVLQFSEFSQILEGPLPVLQGSCVLCTPELTPTNGCISTIKRYISALRIHLQVRLESASHGRHPVTQPEPALFFCLDNSSLTFFFFCWDYVQRASEDECWASFCNGFEGATLYRITPNHFQVLLGYKTNECSTTESPGATVWLAELKN